MLDILKGRTKEELKYCLVVVDAAGVMRAVCDTDTNKLAELARDTKGACLIEVHPEGKAFTVCDNPVNISKLLKIQLK
ncbi:MAG: hypothetical protein RXO32_10760 [Thermoproteus sp.]